MSDGGVDALTIQELREKFTTFFETKGHACLPSAPLIPPEDPTLMFVNAGMVQFKDVFLGKQSPPARSVVTIQKCLRISGKHNDFDEVGFTNRHLTFFEMLGNFSFGGYFKKEAIEYAWTFLVDVCGLPPNRLYATVHPTDKESRAIWQDVIKIPKDRIYEFDEDNFWQMADVGPCGPCTEIHMDFGDRLGPVGGDNVVGGSGPRFVEVWNVVFMQFERQADGTQKPLPTPCVDTGMSLERLAAAMSNETSVYDTEEFRTIRTVLETVTGVKQTEHNQIPFRVVCDHIRSIVFLMSEGLFPSNEGRGYVLRRIVRRALRFVGQLGAFPHALSDVFSDTASLYGRQYPEVLQNAKSCQSLLHEEEARFFDIVRRGSHFLDVEVKKLRETQSSVLSGDVAFKLHDTFGFPIDLTRVVAKEHGVTVDEVGFEAALKAQRERSRAGLKEAEGALVDQARQNPSWFDGLPATKFLGYETFGTEGTLLRVLPHEGGQGDDRLLVFDQTPFYATSGGQVGDVGVIKTIQGGVVARVLATERGMGEGVVVHVARLESTVQEGEKFRLEVDERARRATMAHHTATHLLHAGLRHVLGAHVRQQGSFVGPTELRFDFSHNKKVSDEELRAIEAWANARIEEAHPVTARFCGIEEAKDAGTLMFFDEKYGDEVRQLSVGTHTSISLELCGGTHVANTAEIGEIEIVLEQSIAQGIRRIVALAGRALERKHSEDAKRIGHVARLLGVAVSDVPSTVDRLTFQVEKNQKSIEDLLDALGRAWSGGMDGKQQQGYVFEWPGVVVSKKGIKKLMQRLLKKPEFVVLLVGRHVSDPFMLWFGAGYKKELALTQRIFENMVELCGARGGGKGLQFQGTLAKPLSVDREVLEKKLNALLG